jgi:hypothetical protein
MDCVGLGLFDITTTRGLVDALLKLEHAPLDVLPEDRVPSIHRYYRVHSVFTSTRTSTVHVAVSPSAYPGAFPRALASETIPFPIDMRLTPAPFGAPVLMESPWGVTPFLGFVCRCT